MYRIAKLATCFFLIASHSTALAQEKPIFEGLGFLEGGADMSIAQAVSADGSVVVGQSLSENGPEAFRWEEGEMEGLGYLPGGNVSTARAVSADGSVVIGESNSENGIEAFRWEEGEMEGLGDLPGGDFYSAALDLSADGSVIVGISDSGEIGYEAFRWEDGKMEGMGDLEGGFFESGARSVSADGSIVVGQSHSGNGPEAFRWDGGEMTGLGSLPGDNFWSVAHAVTADGFVIVGASDSKNGNEEAFRWEGGKMEGLGSLAAGEDFFSQAFATSGDGSMIVGRTGSDDGFVAFLWTREDGMQDLKEVLQGKHNLDLTGWTLFTAVGISDDGAVIVGYGLNPDGNIEAWRVTGLRTVANEATPESLADVLSAPSPNPTNGISTFTIAVERSQHVTVEVFDLMGRRVQSLYEGSLASGVTQTLRLHANALPSGVYVIRSLGEDFVDTRRVTVVR